MIILSQHINIRLKSLKIGMMLLLVCLLSGCTAALPEEIAGLVAVKKENCWPCTGFKAVWEGLASLTNAIFPKMCGWALDFLGVALLFWIAFTVCKYIMAVKEPNLKDFISSIAMVLFKAVAISAVLLTPENTKYVLDLFITPAITAFVNLSRAIMFSDATLAKNFAGAIDYDTINTSTTLFASNVGNMLQDIVYRVYLGFNSGIALGARMLISIDMVSWGMGFFTMFVFFYLMLVIPMIFMEGFIIVAIVFVMFPFFLVSYVFPSTKNYLKVGWEALFVAVMQIMVTCIYLTVLLSVVKTYSKDFSIGKQLTDFMFMTNLKDMTGSSLSFFALIYCIFKMSNDIPAMTSFLAGSFNRTQILQMVRRFSGMASNVGKFAIGASLVGSGVGATKGQAMMKDATAELGRSLTRGAAFTGGDGSGNVNRSAEAASAAAAKAPK